MQWTDRPVCWSLWLSWNIGSKLVIDTRKLKGETKSSAESSINIPEIESYKEGVSLNL